MVEYVAFSNACHPPRALGTVLPDKPSSSLLRARTTTDYDDQGRVFRTRVYSVDPSTGAISSTALTIDT